MIREYSVQVVTRMPQYRTETRFGTRFPGILLAALLALAPRAGAQVTVPLQGGLVSGQVRDRDTGQPVAYALVLLPGPDLRVFTSESGRFGVAGLTPGDYTLEVRQVGYAPASAAIRVVAEGSLPGTAPLVIAVARQALVLPEVSVTATVCQDPARQSRPPAAQAILDQAITNAERLLAMERDFPVRARFERLVARLGAADSVLGFRWDTLVSESERGESYRPGRVVQRPRLQPATIRYFTTSDIARREFLEQHCFWVIGEEMLDSVRVIRIDFAPAERLRSPDWAGSLFLDARTSLLHRSEASLTRVPRNLGGLRSTRCEVGYVEIVPTLVHEKTADCRTEVEDGPVRLRREVWGLLGWEFTGRRPGG